MSPRPRRPRRRSRRRASSSWWAWTRWRARWRTSSRPARRTWPARGSWKLRRATSTNSVNGSSNWLPLTHSERAMPKHDDFMHQLRATFRVEAAEHLHAMAAGLEKLGADGAASDRAELIESIYRAAHSLKGAARAADFIDIESLCQSLETTFAAWRRGSSLPTPLAVESAHALLDRMDSALSRDPAPSSAPPAIPAIEVRPMEAPAPTPASPPSSPPELDTVRVSLRALDERLLEAEELLAAK